MKGKIVLLLTVSASMVLLVACSSGTGASSSPQSRPSTSSVVNTGTTAPTGSVKNGYPSHTPGAEDVSTMVRGQQFLATPNFFYFASCGRPCWLPLYPTAQLKGPDKVTDNYPYERFAGNPGDPVKVVCQVQGDTLKDDTQRSSDLWDKVIVPKSAQSILKRSVFTTTATLHATPDGKGYFAYGADIWLGNTGNHGIPCT